VTALVGSVQRRKASYVAVLSIGLSLFFSLSMIPDVLSGNIIDLRTTWLYSQLGILLDPLSVLMACLIGCIGLLVAAFSAAYMKDEPSLVRFWFLIQFFIGGYMVIVLANNLLFMFVGWEIVGVCCSGLAAFWHKDSERAETGLKTFLILHVADLLLLTAILLIYAYSGTFNIVDLQNNNAWISELARSGLLFGMAFMFFGGAVGKSAQFPFQEWLPDALSASPSSFNALTECLAGPFIMARMFPVFHPSNLSSLVGYSALINFFLVMTLLGVLTAIITALIAIVQTNIFKVLSYCISSVIGYMMVAFGLAGLMNDFSLGYLAGTFLLSVDAFVSALLFLNATYMSHKVRSDNLNDMSMIKSRLAHRSMEVGTLAVAGIPPLSGFWCTNWIQNVSLEYANEAWTHGLFTHAIFGYLIFALLIIAGGITAFYALRMMGLIFGGEHEADSSPISEESPLMMSGSLVATLLITIFLDFLALLLIWPFNVYLLPNQLVFRSFSDVFWYLVPSISTLLTCVAVGLGGYPARKIYFSRQVDPNSLMERYDFLKTAKKILENRFYINSLYLKIARSIRVLSLKIHKSLEHGLNVINNMIARYSLFIAVEAYKNVETEGITYPEISGFIMFYETITKRVVTLSKWVYPRIELGGFEGFNRKLAEVVAFFSRSVRRLQTGVLSYNVLAIPVGIVLMIIVILRTRGVL
jgi:NADH-quinone oxidoreductase subunit L